MIRMTSDNVLIQLEEPPKQTASGIQLVHDRKPGARETRIARVLASGPGHYRQIRKKLGEESYTVDGPFIPNETRAGDRVLVDAMAGQHYALDVSIPRHNKPTGFDEWLGARGEFRIIREDEVLCAIDEESEAAE